MRKLSSMLASVVLVSVLSLSSTAEAGRVHGSVNVGVGVPGLYIGSGYTPYRHSYYPYYQPYYPSYNRYYYRERPVYYYPYRHGGRHHWRHNRHHRGW